MKSIAMNNAAVDSTIEYVQAMRLNNPNYLDRIVFCFPRVKGDMDDDWQDASAHIAAASAIARQPETAREQPPPVKAVSHRHPIPSVIVRLSGIKDVEYHGSRKNWARLLRLGIAVIQRDRDGFFVRIPLSSPMYHGQPYQFDVSE